MNCAHCCYNCTMRGRHGKYSTIIDAINFAWNMEGGESIAIGGGEPTLHPYFFDILERCLSVFSYVWMATNGSQTDKMFRIANIINDEDYPDCECTEDEIDSGYCTCYDKGIYSNGKLSVELSQDYFHDEIDQRIINIWNRNRLTHFGIRDVTKSNSGIAGQGRAKITGSGWSDHCVCSDIIIKPSGKLKLCGCTNSPYIGDIWKGVMPKYEKIIYENESFNDERCYKAINKKEN